MTSRITSSLSRVRSLTLARGPGSGYADAQAFSRSKANVLQQCRRRLEAARQQFEACEIAREKYLRRKSADEQMVGRWERCTTEDQKIAMQISVAAEAANTLARLWEDSDDETRQGMVRQLFETLVVDLDQQRIVDFRLKPWAAPFLVLKAPLYPEFNASPI